MRLAFPGLAAALAEGATVVAPTPSLASVAVEQFNRSQLRSGQQSWERPDIHSMEAWMVACWQQARFSLPNAPLLLSLSQERELWRQIIEQDRPDLFDFRAMAHMAQRAASTLAEYQIPTSGEGWNEHADAQKFLRWHEALQAKLKTENWITRSDLWRLIPLWISKCAIQIPNVMFVALTSVGSGLRTLSRALGDSVKFAGLTQSVEPSNASVAAHESLDQEMEQVARAVRQLLETKRAHSIGILVADLAAHASDLIRILNEVLYPSSSPGDHVHVQSAHWTGEPVIVNALLLLELAQPRIQYAAAGAILRSPFIDGARVERSNRAKAANKLFRARELEFSDSDIDKAAWDCPILYQVLRRIAKVKRSLAPQMRLPAWSAAFSDILEAAKWPALDSITDAERRAVDQWNAALSELASLGLVCEPVTLNDALLFLQSILARPVQWGDWSSPVQILDAGACEGIEFDDSFLVNMGEESWPAAIRLSPLIPYKLQRLHQVPGSNPDSAAEIRARRSAALLSSAPTVYLSHTGTISPLMRRQRNGSEPKLWSGLIARQSYSPVECEFVEDRHAPPIQQPAQVSGGAGVIKAQSQCPFKAFAEYRLNAHAEDEACFGFDALERGIFAHKALESVWRELGSQQQLKALPPEALRAFVERHVNDAVRAEDRGPIHSLISSAERDRLVSVILQWLAIEKERRISFVVDRLEDKREFQVSGLQLTLRMDRVDRLPNGRLVLIDYKSGAQTQSKLEGDRPREPQLLVYAAAADEPVDGLYFGELQNRKARPVGYGSAEHFHKHRSAKEHEDWTGFLASSRDAVQRLAEEFVNGHAAVDPLLGACDYCDIKPFCRISSAGLAQEDEE